MTNRFAELLLQILHADAALPRLERLTVLTADDWSAFTTEAIRYRLAFQVLECLTSDPQRQRLVPAACLGRFKDAVRATLMQNLRQQAHLRKMLVACKAADLPVMLVKGLWLNETVYRDLKARTTGDIDLLFHPKDVARLTVLARELGFDLPLNLTNIQDMAPGSKEIMLVHPAQNACFDIHWALTDTPDKTLPDEQTLWSRSEVVTLAGAPCRSLCVEDHLLYLCFHAAGQHHFLYVGPRALLDVARLITTPPRPIDWDDLIGRARELGWHRAVWLMLELVREHLGVQPPQPVLDALRPGDGNDAGIRVAAMEALFLDQQHRQKIALNLVRLLDEPTWGKRATRLAGRLFPPREDIALYFRTPVNSPAIYWLYLKRLGILVRNEMPKLGRLALGDSARSAELARTQVIERWMAR